MASPPPPPPGAERTTGRRLPAPDHRPPGRGTARGPKAIRFVLQALYILTLAGLVAGLALQATPSPAAVTAGTVLIAAALLLLAVFFATGETAVATVRRARVQQLVEEGAPAAGSLQRLLENPVGFWHTSRLVTAGALIGAVTLLVAVAASPLTSSVGNPVGAYVLLFLGALLLGVVPVQQVGPALGTRFAEPVALALAGPLRATVWALSPLVRLLDVFGNVIYRGPRPTPGGVRAGTGTAAGVTEAQIMLQVDVAEEEGVLEEDEGEMIRSIFEFGDTVAREIMVPRIDVKAVPETATLAEAVDQAVLTGHSRIPIFKDTIDNVTGIFYVKDSLRFLRDGHVDVRVREVMREAHFVPETKKVDDLLQEMQSRRVHVAIVVDEYGGTAGLLTIEDILEEIVGEIQDEFDAEEPPVVPVSEHEVVVDALMTLDDLNDLLSLDLHEEDVDTLAGYVYARLGRVPREGDEIDAGGTRLIVEEVEGNRINKVRIVKPAVPAPVPPPPAPSSGLDSPAASARPRKTLPPSAAGRADAAPAPPAPAPADVRPADD